MNARISYLEEMLQPRLRLLAVSKTPLLLVEKEVREIQAELASYENEKAPIERSQ